ncbi:MAG: DUF2062 domain-containing protein [Pseudomonadota bacterium]
MLGRRKKLKFWLAFSSFLWPKLGWRRLSIYWSVRLLRLGENRSQIARGFAFGAALSFTPLIGLHILFAAAMAWLTGANVPAAAIGTLVGNPWTFPFIWWWIYWLGSRVLGSSFDASQQIAATGEIPDLLDMAKLALEHIEHLIAPMMIGGLLTAPFVWILCFYLCRTVLQITTNRFQSMRDKRNATAKKQSLVP